MFSLENRIRCGLRTSVIPLRRAVTTTSQTTLNREESEGTTNEYACVVSMSALLTVRCPTSRCCRPRPPGSLMTRLTHGGGRPASRWAASKSDESATGSNGGKLRRGEQTTSYEPRKSKSQAISNGKDEFG